MNMMRVNERHIGIDECKRICLLKMWRRILCSKFSIKITLNENDTAQRPYYFIKQKDFPHFPRLMIFDACARVHHWCSSNYKWVRHGVRFSVNRRWMHKKSVCLGFINNKKPIIMAMETKLSIHSRWFRKTKNRKKNQLDEIKVNRKFIYFEIQKKKIQSMHFKSNKAQSTNESGRTNEKKKQIYK